MKLRLPLPRRFSPTRYFNSQTPRGHVFSDGRRKFRAITAPPPPPPLVPRRDAHRIDIYYTISTFVSIRWIFMRFLLKRVVSVPCNVPRPLENFKRLWEERQMFNVGRPVAPRWNNLRKVSRVFLVANVSLLFRFSVEATLTKGTFVNCVNQLCVAGFAHVCIDDG